MAEIELNDDEFFNNINKEYEHLEVIETGKINNTPKYPVLNREKYINYLRCQLE